MKDKTEGAEASALPQPPLDRLRQIIVDFRTGTKADHPWEEHEVNTVRQTLDVVLAKIDRLRGESARPPQAPERVFELAWWEAWRRHNKASDADGYGASSGHAGLFFDCAHEDCKLVHPIKSSPPDGSSPGGSREKNDDE